MLTRLKAGGRSGGAAMLVTDCLLLTGPHGSILLTSRASTPSEAKTTGKVVSFVPEPSLQQQQQQSHLHHQQLQQQQQQLLQSSHHHQQQQQQQQPRQELEGGQGQEAVHQMPLIPGQKMPLEDTWSSDSTAKENSADPAVQSSAQIPTGKSARHACSSLAPPEITKLQDMQARQERLFMQAWSCLCHGQDIVSLHFILIPLSCSKPPLLPMLLVQLTDCSLPNLHLEQLPRVQVYCQSHVLAVSPRQCSCG